MPSEPDYVVIRRAANLPEEFHTGNLDGTWFDRSSLPAGDCSADRAGAIAVATGRFEFRADGACAEVFEIRV